MRRASGVTGGDLWAGRDGGRSRRSRRGTGTASRSWGKASATRFGGGEPGERGGRRSAYTGRGTRWGTMPIGLCVLGVGLVTDAATVRSGRVGLAGSSVGCASWAWQAVKIQKRCCCCMQPPGTCTDVYNHRTSNCLRPVQAIVGPTAWNHRVSCAQHTALARPMLCLFVDALQSLLTRRSPPVSIGPWASR